MAILLFTAIVVPYRLAFVDKEPIGWQILYYAFDFVFLIDIILCFMTSYKDEYTQAEVFNHKLIA
jgi:hypothetical protein